MPMPVVVGMELSEFFKLRTQYEQRARERVHDRLNHGDDTQFHQCVLEELAMDLLSKVSALKAEVDTLKALIGAE